MNRAPGVWATVAVVLLMAALSLWAAPDVPDRVPLRFGLDGEPTRYGSRLTGLLLLPLLAAGMGLLLWALPLVDPRRRHLEQSSRAYLATWIAVLVLLLAVHATVLLTATGRDVPVRTLTAGGASLLLLVVGNYMGKIRSNWFFDIRTPWTLTSERSWDLTHRLGGRLFAGLGLAGLLTTAIVPTLAGPVLGAGTVAIVLITFAYSYWAWRTDPTTP